MAPSDISPPSSTKGPTEAFVFATCLPASNAWLRREVGRQHPDLKLAFSAPGLVTWKAPSGHRSALATPLALIAGSGVGRATSADEVARLVLPCAIMLGERRLPVGLHVFHTARDGESEDPGDEAIAAGLSFEVSLRAMFPFAAELASPGAPVVDVIHLRDKPGTYFVGWHEQRSDRPRAVGGVEAKPLNPRAPSRAYSKVWELLRLGELEVQSGDSVLELGAAPGGGTVAWLEQQAAVVAVDPADMSPVVSQVAVEEGADYRHLRKPVGDVAVRELPRRVDFLYSDMNLAPAVVVRYLERICAMGGAPRRAVLMNLKINDPKVEAASGALLERVASFATRLGCELRVAQLPSHRKEIGVVLRRTNHANTQGKKHRT